LASRPVGSYAPRFTFTSPCRALTFQGSKQRKSTREGFGGVKGYLEGIFGNPSLTKIQGKTNKNLRKKKESLRKN